MRAGKLDHLITIEREVEKVRPSGSVVKTWAPLMQMRGEIVRASAEEFLTGFGEAEGRNVLFRIWWRPGITTADRIVCDCIPYNIKEIVEEGRRRSLEIRCST
ncbi:MAG: phage head closure protein [Methylobacterium mesophilicum]|nr:phage head closure protein [Methylobacterium mesophilicum]